MFLMFHLLSVHLDQALQMLPFLLASPGEQTDHGDYTSKPYDESH